MCVFCKANHKSWYIRRYYRNRRESVPTNVPWRKSSWWVPCLVWSISNLTTAIPICEKKSLVTKSPLPLPARSLWLQDGSDAPKRAWKPSTKIRRAPNSDSRQPHNKNQRLLRKWNGLPRNWKKKRSPWRLLPRRRPGSRNVWPCEMPKTNYWMIDWPTDGRMKRKPKLRPHRHFGRRNLCLWEPSFILVV